MKISQFGYASDNFGYLVYHHGTGIAIDGGAPEKMVKFAHTNEIDIKLVTNTHTHADHTSGNDRLLELTDAKFLDCRSVSHGQKIPLGNETLEIMLTPGHTKDCVCFKGDGFVVTGDTLFNGTVGNCFSGDLNAFYTSLSLLMALPGDTQVYAGHDYVMESLKYAAIIEPDNPNLNAYRKKYDPDHVVFSLSDELTVNPYIRFNAPEMIQRLTEKNLPRDTEFERFASIMEIY